MVERNKGAILLFCSLLTAACLLCGCSKKAGESPTQREMKAMQGTWVGAVAAGSGGSWTFAVTENRIDIGGPGREEWYKGTLQVDLTADPKQISFAIEQCMDDDFVGKTSLGIYKLDGDMLTIAANAPGQTRRPASFEKKDSDRLWILNKR